MSPRGRRDSGSRSEDDRQRARLEREQRRARREGRPIPRSLDDLDPTAGLTGDHAAIGGEAFGTADGPRFDDAAPPAGTSEQPQPSAGHEAYAAPGHEVQAAPAPGPERAREAPADDAPTQPQPQPAAPQAAATQGATTDAPHDGESSRAADSRPETPAPAAPAATQPWWATADQDTPPAPAAPPAAAPRTPPAEPAARAPAAVPPVPSRAESPRAEPPRTAPSPASASPAAAPRGNGAPDRPVDDWFGPDETGEHTGEHAAASGGTPPPLVPLKPAGPAPRAGVTPATVKARTAPARRGVSRIAAVLVLVPIVLVLVGAYLLFEPGKGGGEGTVQVKIPEGSSVSDIGTLLQEKGVIANPVAFAIRARISGAGANLKAGTLKLKKDMSYGAALTALQQDPLPPSVVSVGLPEGLSRREAAPVVKKAGLQGSYLSASAKSKGFDPRDYGQPRSRSGLEGFLFPATYELPKGGATAKALVAKQVDAFADNVRQVDFDRAKRAKLSRYDVLIIASMIEREVRVPSERKLVAAVIWNRLKDGTALGIDATTRYAVRNWSRPLTQSEIDRDTPYDTRRKVGLPPTPIGSPGLAAIKAAANPAKVSYRWYVVKPCGGGRHSFASTSAKFDRDVAAYVAAQRRAKGDPSDPDAAGCK